MTKRISSYLTKRPVRTGAAIKSDPQSHRVYRMERRIVGWAIYARVEQADLQRIADYVCRKKNVKRVGVSVLDGGKQHANVFGWCEDSTIHLNADYHGDNTSVLVHELAHYVTSQFWPEADHHGPQFMEVYIDLLDMLNLIPRKQMEDLCHEHDVQWGVPDD